MISEICAELRNYFLRDYVNPEQYMHSGSFVIANGEMQSLPFLKQNQFYRIIGSTFNDGVHQYGVDNGLIDETFEGTIWEMFVPKEVVDLSAEIQDWVSNNADTINSPYQSESTPVYSRTYKQGSGASGSYGWRDAFSERLKEHRRISVL